MKDSGKMMETDMSEQGRRERIGEYVGEVM